ncbi:hypothetical protein QJS10_CPA05g00769 [Acorus calamus]|uniref:Calmodulin-binding domain-containing protein n=1 Tax=Acorus calamus TaxID=4465 RepID=A0AAV9ETA1_ACOCL|nr:hypothetical protein QJS10_CPA05g00769 [Acorus calamus]
MVQRKSTKKQNSQSNPIDVTKSDKRPTRPSSSLYQDIKSKAGGGGGGGAEVKKKTMKKTRSIRVPPRLENLSIDKPVKRSPNYMRPTSCSESRQVSSPSQTPPKASKASSLKIFTRKSSLRPIRPSMKKSSSSSNRATCSSTLKDSKFPANLDLNVGGTESEGTSVLKVCPYTHCSLNGHHHHEPLPPLKRFVNARRRSLKAQKSLRSRGGGASKSRNRGVEKATDDDFFVEIYTERKAEMETEMSFGDEFDGKSDSSNGGMGYLEFFEKERSNRFGGELGVNESVFEWVDMDWEGQTDQYVNGGIDSGVDGVESHTINIVGGTSESTDEDHKPNDVLENPSMESLEMELHVPFVEWIGGDSFEGVTEEIQDSIENHESEGDSVLEDAKAPQFVESVPIADLEGEIDDIKQAGVVGDSIEIQFSGSHEVPLRTEQGSPPKSAVEVIPVEVQSCSGNSNEDHTESEDAIDKPSSESYGSVKYFKADGESMEDHNESDGMIDNPSSDCYGSVRYHKAEVDLMEEYDESDGVINNPSSESYGSVKYYKAKGDSMEDHSESEGAIDNPNSNSCGTVKYYKGEGDLMEDHNESSGVVDNPSSDIHGSINYYKAEGDHNESEATIINPNSESYGRVKYYKAEVDSMEDHNESEDAIDDSSSNPYGSIKYYKAGAQDDDSESEENQARSKNRILANQRRAREVSNQAKEREFNPRAPNFLPVEPDQEGEKVDLKHGMVDERKNSEEWMVDYALRQAVDKLAPKRRKKVALLVEAFETVLPTPKWEAPRGYVNGGFVHARTIQACS